MLRFEKLQNGFLKTLIICLDFKIWMWKKKKTFYVKATHLIVEIAELDIIGEFGRGGCESEEEEVWWYVEAS